ncbi:NAD+ kinase [Halopenitus malekzadehii]|uniref:NAD+ kinase n=1 Tax=Halopenitus malekzadehii TaxID=1267564 RepID=A0A1H6HV84_9EURY|nr:NAD(+)/NADH kinase [Halopenitus malekzadehii]SEH40036.1 NAD+ kinase [Halopenitus malekzadehii]
MSRTGREVAIVGADRGLPETVRRLGGSVVEPAAADLVVAVGEDAFRDAARGDSTVPILVVGVPDAYYAVAFEDAEVAIQALLSAPETDRPSPVDTSSDADHPAHIDRSRVIDHPIVAVTVDGDRRDLALLDVTLLTSEPARISEYGVTHGGETLQTFRADAVTVATPAGSTGYARAAGGPVVRPGTGLVVVPIAPFTTHTDTVVLPGSVTLSVERDDEPVSIVVDGIDRGPVPAHAPIEISVVDHASVVSPLHRRSSAPK